MNTLRRPVRVCRRGAVLIVVMIIIALAALIGTSVLYVADAQRGSASLTLSQARLRSLAWSGVQAAMAEMQAQRAELLKGSAPKLTASWQLWKGSQAGQITLTALGPDDAHAVSEAGKLDINMASDAMLALLPGMSDTLAGAVVQARGPGFGSPEELAGVKDLSLAVLLDAGAEEGPGEAPGARGLLALTTVFAADPNVEAASGEPRINVSGGWTPELAEALEARLEKDLFKALEPSIKSGRKLTRDEDLLTMLDAAKVTQPQRARVLDVVTVSDDAYVRGRVDLNQAPVEVLSAVPGIDRAAAEKIIDARTKVSSEDRARATWPLTQGIVSDAAFAQAMPWLTTRSLQWRIRVEARLGDAAEENPFAGRQGARLDESVEAETPAPTVPTMIWEAVIDVAGPEAHVAYLRDITHLGGVVKLALTQEQSGIGTSEDGTLASTAGSEDPDRANHDAQPLRASDLIKNRNIQPSGALKRQTMKKMDFNIGGGLKLQSKLEEDSGGKVEAPAGTDGARAGDSSDGADSTTPGAPQDRRIGRWRGSRKE